MADFQQWLDNKEQLRYVVRLAYVNAYRSGQHSGGYDGRGDVSASDPRGMEHWDLEDISKEMDAAFMGKEVYIKDLGFHSFHEHCKAGEAFIALTEDEAKALDPKEEFNSYDWRDKATAHKHNMFFQYKGFTDAIDKICEILEIDPPESMPELKSHPVQPHWEDPNPDEDAANWWKRFSNKPGEPPTRWDKERGWGKRWDGD
jgi:hypothetical protein